MEGSNHFIDIYTRHAAEYDQLVAREDYRHELPRALAAIRPAAGLDMVELGAGTGRVTQLLAPYAHRLTACDISPHMMSVAATKLRAGGRRHWQALVADNAHLPLADRCADLALAGWSLGHQTGWNPAGWRMTIGQALAEVRRVLRPGGTAVIIETLGTGRETPQPPSPALAEYYAWLEREHGFSATWIRTDYRFASLEEAVRLTGFFFGEEFAARVAEHRRVDVPECTGIWWRTVGG